MRTVDHVWFEELEICHVGIVTLKLAHVSDLCQLDLDELIVQVALGVDQGEDVVAFVPSVLSGKPARRFRQEEKPNEQTQRGQHLQAPGHTEGGDAIDIAGSIGDIEHDHDTPRDRPLLGAHHPAALARRRQFGDVDRNLRRADSDGQAVDEAAHDEHADVLRGAHNDRSHAPNDGADLDGLLPTEDVGEKAGDEGTDEGATGHGGGDPTLRGRQWTGALVWVVGGGIEGALVEITGVLPCSQTGDLLAGLLAPRLVGEHGIHGTLGGNICCEASVVWIHSSTGMNHGVQQPLTKTEEGTTQHRNGGDDVDVPNRHTGGLQVPSDVVKAVREKAGGRWSMAKGKWEMWG